MSHSIPLTFLSRPLRFLRPGENQRSCEASYFDAVAFRSVPTSSFPDPVITNKSAQRSGEATFDDGTRLNTVTSGPDSGRTVAPPSLPCFQQLVDNIASRTQETQRQAVTGSFLVFCIEDPGRETSAFSFHLIFVIYLVTPLRIVHFFRSGDDKAVCRSRIFSDYENFIPLLS
jgi:hypothetical protein